MLKILAILIAATASCAATYQPTGSYYPPKVEQIESRYPVFQVTCYLSSEKESGMSKICYYGCTCGTKALNVQGYQLCPLSYNFEC